MSNKKATKRALLTSILAICLCLVMLIGSTFAWFTDTASTGVNKIQSGTLKLALEMQDASGKWVDAEGETLDFKKAAGAPADEKVLWEPGCTYELPALRIRNDGNLALKYKIAITGVTGNAKLLKAIDFTVKVGDPALVPNTDEGQDGGEIDVGDDTTTPTDPEVPAESDPGVASLNNFEGVLLPNEATGTITITGVMDKNAGNDYQGLSIDGVAITVTATQKDHEYDSNGNDYDAGAEYAEGALPGAVANYSLSEFNALTEIPEGIKTVYVDVGNLSVTGYSKCATIGNYNLSDQYMWVKDGETAPEGFTATSRRNAQNNATAYRTNKDGITVYVTGSMTMENYSNGSFSGFQTLCFQLPEKSNVIMNGMTLNGSFNISGQYTYMYNLPNGDIGSASEGYTNVWYGFPFVVENIKLSNCTINGQWFANGDVARNVEISGCTFNDYQNTEGNWGNPLWWKNAPSTNLVITGCNVTSTRPMKVGEGGIGSVAITNNTFTMLDGDKYTGNTDDRVKNTALCFGNKINGNVTVTGNTVNNTATALISFLDANMTMPSGKAFTVSDNTLNGVKTSVVWKSTTEFTPDFLK